MRLVQPRNAADCVGYAPNTRGRNRFLEGLARFLADHIVTQLKERDDPWRLNEEAPVALPPSASPGRSRDCDVSIFGAISPLLGRVRINS
jgi:hypothetical protein